MSRTAEELRRSLTMWTIVGVVGILLGLGLLFVLTTDDIFKVLGVLVLIFGVALVAATIWMRLQLERSAGEAGEE